jgi:alpha-L-arabinofuranosidase
MSSFGAWEAIVLAEAYDEIDLIPAHSYSWQKGDDLASFLASGVKLDHFLDEIVATADLVRSRRAAVAASGQHERSGCGNRRKLRRGDRLGWPVRPRRALRRSVGSRRHGRP